MNEAFIQTLLMRSMLVEKKHRALITNSTQLLYSEADLISVTKAGLVHEFEIKCSRSDYKAEFRSKKSKHHFLKMRLGAAYIPNYYWFVTYEFDIEPPDYAGWIKVCPVSDARYYPNGTTHYLAYNKNAPRLHGEKWNDEKIARIARLLSFRLLKAYENNRQS